MVVVSYNRRSIKVKEIRRDSRILSKINILWNLFTLVSQMQQIFINYIHRNIDIDFIDLQSGH